MTDTSGKKVNYFTGESESENPTKRHIITIGGSYNPGIYTITATTTEGLTAKAEIQLAPAKINLTGLKSVGTTNSSTVTWDAYSSASKVKYYVYLLKNGKYKKVGETSSAAYTFKKLSAGKTYSFKISTVLETKNKKGKKVVLEGEKSDVYKFVTAPSEKPVITGLSCVSSKYHPKTWQEGLAGYWDGAGVWHKPISGYWIAANSTAEVKVNVKSSKVFKSYQYEEGVPVYVKDGQKITFKYSGKIGSKTQKVKLRGVVTLDKYNSIAYGNWSEAKSVTIKAAK